MHDTSDTPHIPSAPSSDALVIGGVEPAFPDESEQGRAFRYVFFFAVDCDLHGNLVDRRC